MRRFLAHLAVLALAFVAGAACAGDDPTLSLHVLNRLAYGPSTADMQAIRTMGVDRWIDQQLHPETIAELRFLTERLAEFATVRLDPVALFGTYGPPVRPGEKPDPTVLKEVRERQKIVVTEAVAARLMQDLWSRRQLQQVLTDFWFNHFNVFAEKQLDRLWVGNFAEAAIRPHVLGRFRDLLAATVYHPAMQVYLDNTQNTAPGTGRHGGKGGLNENYARELMELHTLGVGGGYTQDDVIALARILTGWGVAGVRRGDGGPAVTFDPRRHDDSDKLFLGHRIAGSGAAELDQALDILASSPATARHLSTQLAEFFVADAPPPALVDHLTTVWMGTGGDIRAVLTALFASAEFRSPANDGAKFKTPDQFVLSAVRAAGIPTTNVRPLFDAMRELGEPPFLCLTPDGYKDTRAAWLNPDALVMRANIATSLAAGRLKLTAPDPDQPAVLEQSAYQPVDADAVEALLAPGLSPHTTLTVAAAPAQLRAALLLGSPDFMRR